eukprot:COSAG02_NODE_477_length_21523_cov_11.763163_22_plen_41_part_00
MMEHAQNRIVNQCVFLVCKNCAVLVDAAHWNSIIELRTVH